MAVKDLRINNNVPNTTATGTGENGKTGNVSVICYEGFRFAEAPTAQFNDWNGDFNSKTFVLSEDGKQANLTFSDCDTTESVNVYGETVPDSFKEPTDVVLDNNVDNTTATAENTDTGVKITLTGKFDKYRFTQTPTAYFKTTAGQTESTDFDVDKSVASVEIADVDFKEPVVITGKFEPVVLVSSDFEFCTVTGLKDFYRQTDVINVYLSANNDCLFTDDNEKKLPVLSFTDNNGDFIVKNFTVSEDRKTASLTTLVSLLDVSDGETIHFHGSATRQTEDFTANYGTFTPFVVTMNELEQFAQKRFFKETGSDGLNYQVVDLGKYVSSLKRVFVDFDSTVDSVLKLGDYDLKIPVKTLTNDRVLLDFGAVEIPLMNDDITDYNSTVEIFLPFVGMQPIDTAYCGKSVTLQYDVNLITGGAVAKLFCEGLLISLHSCEPSTSIQYRTTDFNLIGEQTFNNSLMYGLKPFIKIKWFKSENKNLYNSDNDRVLIGSVKGFAKLAEVTDITDPIMTGEEKRLIYSLLNSGVYVEPPTEPAEPADESGNLLWDDGTKILWDDGTAIKL